MDGKFKAHEPFVDGIVEVNLRRQRSPLVSGKLGQAAAAADGADHG